MKIKRFKASDMATATHLIKDEFGLNAIILSQREISAEEGGGVEITAGVKEEDLPTKNEASDFKSALAASTTPEAPLRPKRPPQAALNAYLKNEAAAPGPAAPNLNKELDLWGSSLSTGLEEIKTLILDLAHRQSLSEKWRERADLVKLYRKLTDTGLSQVHARQLVESAAQSAQAWGGEVDDHLRKTVKTRMVDLSVNPPKSLALVGPSGAGKTQALVNLAAFFRLKGKKVAAITLDTIRLGAAEQLTQYLRIMGIGLKICESNPELKEALEVFESQDIILIDTPSRNFQSEDLRLKMTDTLELASASTLLVVPATMKSSDLNQALKKGRGWPLAGVIISKLDETGNFGNLIEFLIESAPDLAFFSEGPKTTEDFKVADLSHLMDLWLKNS